MSSNSTIRPFHTVMFRIFFANFIKFTGNCGKLNKYCDAFLLFLARKCFRGVAMKWAADVHIT